MTSNLSEYSDHTIRLAEPFISEQMKEEEKNFIYSSIESIEESKREDVVYDANSLAQFNLPAYITGTVLLNLNYIENRPRSVAYAVEQLKENPVDFTKDPLVLIAHFVNLIKKVPTTYAFTARLRSFR